MIDDIGKLMHKWATDLWPIPRSITGPGVRETLHYLQALLPGLIIKSIPSGTSVLDWEIPDEWFIDEAYIIDTTTGHKVIDFKDNNLHILGYSEPIDKIVSLEELLEHIYTQPDNPDAIPYVTSYYKRRWGFCLSENQKNRLTNESYHVVIRSGLEKGQLNYAELIVPGKSKEEILLSTYICHPSMANNELSGPVVTTALSQWLLGMANNGLKYTYRILFIPETIGSIAYLNFNLEHLKKYVVAGFNITCIGDDRCYSFLPSRDGNTISDRVAKHVLQHIDRNYVKYSWLDRGSDERQYCAPGIDLPIASIMRSKFGEYPEYHTSLDNLDFITPSGLAGGYFALKEALSILEDDGYPVMLVLGEPQLGKRGLYPTISQKGSAAGSIRDMMNIISYCDGKQSILEIADRLDLPFSAVKEVVWKLKNHKLLNIEKSKSKNT